MELTDPIDRALIDAAAPPGARPSLSLGASALAVVDAEGMGFMSPRELEDASVQLASQQQQGTADGGADGGADASAGAMGGRSSWRQAVAKIAAVNAFRQAVGTAGDGATAGVAAGAGAAGVGGTDEAAADDGAAAASPRHLPSLLSSRELSALASDILRSSSPSPGGAGASGAPPLANAWVHLLQRQLSADADELIAGLRSSASAAPAQPTAAAAAGSLQRQFSVDAADMVRAQGRAQGNAAFLAGDFEGAARLYSAGLAAAGGGGDGSREHAVASEHVVPLLSNRAHALIRLGRYSAALVDAKRVQAADPTSWRGYQRAGQAYAGLRQPERELASVRAQLALGEGQRGGREEARRLRLRAAQLFRERDAQQSAQVLRDLLAVGGRHFAAQAAGGAVDLAALTGELINTVPGMADSPQAGVLHRIVAALTSGDEGAFAEAFDLHAAQQAGGRGVPQAEIDALPRVEVTQASVPGAGGDDTCCICLTSYEEGEEAVVLPACAHHFHATCVCEWLASASTCPMCRADVAVQDVDAIPQER
jgi:tetratricopeptide (TPR) repeat protein